MTVEETVRRAELADCDELGRLDAIAREAIREVRGGALRLQECAADVDWPARVQDPQWVVLVGAIDEVVVASLAMLLAPDRDRGIVAHVFVEEGARELGLGDTMVEVAIDAVRHAGLSGIESTALPGDRETKNLFERAGLTARKLTVYKALSAP